MQSEDQLEIKLARTDVRAIGDDGVVAGYASIFGNLDSGGDSVQPGAFARSLAARPAAQVRMLWQHDPDEPIGVWEHIAEDARGLFVRGRILGDVARGRDVLSLLRAGAIDGLSIGFKTIRARAGDRPGVRMLLEVDLWEISIVTFPMNEAARIAGVKYAPPDGAENFLSEEQELRELVQAIRQASKAMQPSPYAKASGNKRGIR